MIGAPHWLAEAVSYSGGGYTAALSSKLGLFGMDAPITSESKV